MKNLQSRNIALFFTFGISLIEWRDTGLLNREIAPYLSLVKKGHKVSFITYGTSQDFIFKEQIKGIDIIPIFKNFKNPPGKLIGLIYSLFYIFTHLSLWRNFQIMKSNQMWGAWAPLLASKLSSSKFLARIGYDLYEFNLNKKSSKLKRIIIFYLSKIVYKFSDAILCTSEHTKGFISEQFFINSSKINVHSNYIDTELFKNETPPPFNPRLLFIGRMDTHKNLPLLFKACQLANMPLDIIGAGEEESNLRSLAKELKIDCQFLGRFPNEELPMIMKDYSLFVLTSKSEGNPKALLEAMSCHLCPIGVNVTGIRDIINEQNGFLVESNEKSLSQVFSMIKADPKIIQRKQTESRSYILKNCSLESMINLELSLF